jgi:YaiO family outer membrane protein
MSTDRRRHAVASLLALALLAAPAARAQDADDARWTFTPIYTHSAVGDGRGDWSELDLDLLYRASDRVLLGANVDWRERWGARDTRYTGSIAVQATPTFEWHAAIAATPDADFSPKRSYSAGLDWKALPRLALLLDYRHLEVSGGRLREWRPGAVVWLSDRTWLTARYSDGDAYGTTGYHASTLRLDHDFGGRRKLSLAYTRGVDPERDPLVPGVLLTEADYLTAYYRMPLQPALDLILGAEYEDRSGLYTRTGISIGLVVRF